MIIFESKKEKPAMPVHKDMDSWLRALNDLAKEIKYLHELKDKVAKNKVQKKLPKKEKEEDEPDKSKKITKSQEDKDVKKAEKTDAKTIKSNKTDKSKD